MTVTDETFQLARAVMRSRRYPEQHKKTQRLYDQFYPNRYIEILDEEATLTGIYITMLRGMESGLQPLQALYNIVWYNDRPCLNAEIALALIEGHKDFAGIADGFEGEPMTENWKAVCTINRMTAGEIISITREYSWADAKRAYLDKLPHYQRYPQRMLMIRARGWAMRDLYADVMNGLSIAEEQQDVELLNQMPEEPVRKAEMNAAATMDPFTKAALEKRGQVEKPHTDDLKPGAALPESEKSLEQPENTETGKESLQVDAGENSPEPQTEPESVLKRHAACAALFPLEPETPEDPPIRDVDVEGELKKAEERHKKRTKGTKAGLDIGKDKF